MRTVKYTVTEALGNTTAGRMTFLRSELERFNSNLPKQWRFSYVFGEQTDTRSVLTVFLGSAMPEGAADDAQADIAGILTIFFGKRAALDISVT